MKKNWRTIILRVVGVLCVLTLLLGLLAACGGKPQPPADDKVIDAARKFAVALERAGQDAQEILAQAREEAKKWGPKAQLFIDTVLEELKK